jgi:outer membrane lipoprotein carrier protein
MGGLSGNVYTHIAGELPARALHLIRRTPEAVTYNQQVKIPLKNLLSIGIAVVVLAAHVLALPAVSEVARAVDEHYNRLHSLEAQFTEIYQGAGITRTETGTLWLKKPGKMRWEYRSPEEKLFVGDGKEAWLYLPAEKQVQKSDMRKLEDLRSPLAFLLGKTKLEKELSNLSFAPDVQAWKSGDVILRGVPRGMEDRIQDVMVEVTPDHQLARILIHSADDSLTEYRFSEQKEEIPVADVKFRFTPPAGTEVIENEAGL